jgi:hypothetical protein
MEAPLLGTRFRRQALRIRTQFLQRYGSRVATDDASSHRIFTTRLNARAAAKVRKGIEAEVAESP